MRFLYVILLLTISNIAFSQIKIFKVEVQITGLHEGDTVYLLRRNLEDANILDSFIQEINSGKLIFNVPFREGPTYYRLQPANTTDRAYLFLDNSFITVNGEFKNLSNIQVHGSRPNNDYKAFLEIKKSLENIDSNGQDITDKNLITTAIDKYIETYPNSLYAPLIMLENSYKPEEVISIYQKMNMEVQNTLYGKELKRLIDLSKNSSQHQ